jgi:hypothetical protein
MKNAFLVACLLATVTEICGAQTCRIDSASMTPRPSRAAPGESVALSGRLVSSEGGSVVNLGIVALTRHTDTDSLTMSAHSDGDGMFRFEGLNPGTYSVLVRRLGYSQLTTSIEVRGNVFTCIDLAVSRERAWDPVAVPLEATAADSLELARALGAALGRELKFKRSASRTACSGRPFQSNSATFAAAADSALLATVGAELRARAGTTERVSYSVGDVEVTRTLASVWSTVRPYSDSAEIDVVVNGATTETTSFLEYSRHLFARESGGTWTYVAHELLSVTSVGIHSPSCGQGSQVAPLFSSRT